MFDFIMSSSFIDVKYKGRLYLNETYEQLKSMMNDSKPTITVHIVDYFTGLLTEKNTFKKSDITNYGAT